MNEICSLHGCPFRRSYLSRGTAQGLCRDLKLQGLSIGRNKQALTDRVRPSLPAFAQGVARWLGARLTETYDLQRLAQAFHVSTRTLLRRVKAQTGESPLVLLQRARVEKARQLLSDSAWSITQITEAVGYADVPTFSRLFASYVGETPARYRRRQS